MRKKMNLVMVMATIFILTGCSKTKIDDTKTETSKRIESTEQELETEPKKEEMNENHTQQMEKSELSDEDFEVEYKGYTLE